jgi:hypothetical protein
MKKADPIRIDAEPKTPPALAEAVRLARRGPDAGAVKTMSLALGVAAPLSPPPVPPASELAAAAGTSSSLAGVVALVGAVGVGTTLVTFVVTHESSAPPPPRPTLASAAKVEAKPAAVETPEVSSVEPRPSLPAPGVRRRRADPGPALAAPTEPPAPEPAPPAAQADAASRLREEALLVRSAERLLGSDPGRALTLTEERRRRFPGGALDQEAEVVAIDALLRLGRRDAATARARAFEARHPGSVHARRIRALFGSEP